MSHKSLKNKFIRIINNLIFPENYYFINNIFYKKTHNQLIMNFLY